MESTPLQITITLHSLASSQLTPTHYYQVTATINQQETELAQKRPLKTGILTFNHSTHIEISKQDLQLAKNHGELRIYTLHQQGHKSLLGRTNLQIPTRSTLSFNNILADCSDYSNAFLAFQCTTTELKRKAQSCHKERTSHNKEPEGKQLAANLRKLLSFSSPAINQLQTKPLTARTVKEQYNHKDEGITYPHSHRSSILDQHPLLSFTNVNQIRTEQQLENNHNSNKYSNNNCIQFLAKPNSAMIQTDNQLHKRQFRHKYQQKLQEFFLKASHFEQPNNLAELIPLPLNTPKLKISPRTIHLYIKGNQLIEGYNRRNYKSTTLIASKQVKSDQKTIKSKENDRSESLEEWENDDNLCNMLHSMMNEVKGNLGYIKLSKISQLKKQINQIKQRNQQLIIANQHLLEQHLLLTQQLALTDQTILKNEQLHSQQVKSLQSQLQTLTDYIKEKEEQKQFLQIKLKSCWQESKNYEEKVEKLTEDSNLQQRRIEYLKLQLYQESQKTKGSNPKLTHTQENNYNNSHHELFQGQSPCKEQQSIYTKKTIQINLTPHKQQTEKELNNQQRFQTIERYFTTCRNKILSQLSSQPKPSEESSFFSQQVQHQKSYSVELGSKKRFTRAIS